MKVSRLPARKSKKKLYGPSGRKLKNPIYHSANPRSKKPSGRKGQYSHEQLKSYLRYHTKFGNKRIRREAANQLSMMLLEGWKVNAFKKDSKEERDWINNLMGLATMSAQHGKRVTIFERDLNFAISVLNNGCSDVYPIYSKLKNYID